MTDISIEKFEEIFYSAKKGDSKSQIQYLNQIEGLIINSIRRYYPHYHEYEDLVQDGRVYALYLLKLYKPENLAPPLGFVKTYLRYFYLDKNKRKSEILTLDEPREDGEGNTMCLKDKITDTQMKPDEIIISGELANEFLNVLDSLPFEERDLIYRYFFEHQDAKSIANQYDCTLRNFYYQKEKILQKLKGSVDSELLTCFRRSI